MSAYGKPIYITRQGLRMRNKFDFSKYKLTKWFPGHMAKGTAGIQSKLISVDCIIEVHDARIPISGRNNDIIKAVTMIKPHILVLNKYDLINEIEMKKITKYYESREVRHLMFANCKNHMDETVKELVPKVINLIVNSNRYNRENSDNYGLMVMGVPNVGKSSLINALRSKNLGKKKGASVGPHPGVTKHVMERIKIYEDPPLYVFDTPGILSPKIESTETGLKLALCNTIKNNLIGQQTIADYLLFKMNERGNHSYVDILKLYEPTDDIHELLKLSAQKYDYYLTVKDYEKGGYMDVPDLERMASKYIAIFQTGIFGCLDIDDLMTSMKI